MRRLEALHGNLILLGGWKRAFLGLVIGALSALAMPPFDFFPILLITLPALVWLMDGAATEPSSGMLSKMGPGFRLFWFFGFGYFLAGMWWVGNAFLVDADGFGWLLPFAVLLLPAGLAVFWAFGGALTALLWSSGAGRIFALALGLGLAEYARGKLLTGLPWNALGYSAMTTPMGFQSASLVGLYAVTALAVFVFAAPAVLSSSGTGRRFTNVLVLLLALGTAVGHYGFGYWRLTNSPVVNVEGVSLRLMQPNIDQSKKWQSGEDGRIIARYLQLSTRATSPTKQGLAGTTHLIWPESAFPFVLTERRDALSAFSAMLPEGTTLITGGVRTEKAPPGQSKDFVFNSIYALDSNGEIIEAADKVHLVPFGEYLPFQEFAESLGLRQLTQERGGFAAGNQRKSMRGMTGPAFLPLICYEIIFPGQILGAGDPPQWIVNLTNDGWFGNTPGPYQHKRQALIRGVEEGLPVVRVANTGVSFVSDPFGRMRAEIPLGVEAIADADLPRAEATTYYRTYRELPLYALLGAFFLFSMVGLRTR